MSETSTKRGLTHQERAGISFQVLQYTESIRSKGSLQAIPPGSQEVHDAAVKALVEILTQPSCDAPTPTAPQLPPGFPNAPGAEVDVEAIKAAAQAKVRAAQAAAGVSGARRAPGS